MNNMEYLERCKSIKAPKNINVCIPGSLYDGMNDQNNLYSDLERIASELIKQYGKKEFNKAPLYIYQDLDNFSNYLEIDDMVTFGIKHNSHDYLFDFHINGTKSSYQKRFNNLHDCIKKGWCVLDNFNY